MSDYKSKAEAYVREKLPELMELSFGCEVVVDCGSSGRWKALVTGLMSNGDWRVNLLEKPVKEGDLEIIGHHIQLQHWLRVIGEKEQLSSNLTAIASNGCIYKNGNVVMQFNLTTGQPATEKDYKAFCEIVGVE